MFPSNSCRGDKLLSPSYGRPLLHHPDFPFLPPSHPTEGSVLVASWVLDLTVPGSSILRPRFVFIRKMVRGPDHGTREQV